MGFYHAVRILVITLFLTLWSTAPLHAGKTRIYGESRLSGYTLTYKKSVRPGQNIPNNLIIEEIARRTLKGPSDIRIHYSFETKKEIFHNDLNNYTVNIHLTGFDCSGDVFYKGFDLSPYLLPVKAGMDVSVFWKDDTEIIHKSFPEISAGEEGTFSMEFGFTDLNGGNHYSADLTYVEFHSPVLDFELFRQKLNRINDFYASIHLLGSITDSIEGIFERKGYKDPAVVINVYEYRRILQKIEDEEFSSSIVIPDSLAEIHRQKWIRANQKLESLSLHLPDHLKTLSAENAHFNRYFAKRHIGPMADFFTNAATVRHDHRDFYYSCGHAGYENSFLADISRDLREFRTNGAAAILHEAKRYIFNHYLHTAGQLINHQQFSEASDLLANASDFFHLSMPGQPLPVEFTTLRSQADYGLYKSFLKIAEVAMFAGNYPMAEKYIEKADLYQKTHPLSIISGEEIKTTYEELIDLYLKRAFGLLDQENFSQALSSFMKAQELSGVISRFNFDYEIKHGIRRARNGHYLEMLEQSETLLNVGLLREARESFTAAVEFRNEHKSIIAKVPGEISLQNRLYAHEYRELFAKGKKLAGQKKSLNAFSYLDEARAMQQKYDLEPIAELEKLYIETSKPFISNMLEKGNACLISDSLETARKILSEVHRIVEECDLINDNKICDDILHFEKMVQAKYCQQLQVYLENTIIAVKKNNHEGSHQNSPDQLNRAIELVNENKECNMEKTAEALSELLDITSKRARYHALQEDLVSALEEGDFMAFINHFEELYGLYDLNDGTASVIFPQMKILQAPEHFDKLHTGIQKFERSGDYHHCIRLLKVLEINGLPASEYRKIQKRIGKKMAETDSRKARGNRMVDYISRYTNHTEWFTVFDETYKQHLP